MSFEAEADTEIIWRVYSKQIYLLFNHLSIKFFFNIDKDLDRTTQLFHLFTGSVVSLNRRTYLLQIFLVKRKMKTKTGQISHPYLPFFSSSSYCNIHWMPINIISKQHNTQKFIYSLAQSMTPSTKKNIFSEKTNIDTDGSLLWAIIRRWMHFIQFMTLYIYIYNVHVFKQIIIVKITIRKSFYNRERYKYG